MSKGLRHAQRRADKYLATNRKLEANVESLTAQLTALQLKGKSKKNTTTATLQSGEAILSLGKKWAVVVSPWLEREVFELEGPADPDPLARFKDAASFDLATSHDLLAFVPAKYHEELKGSTEFRNAVCHQSSQISYNANV